MGSWIKAALLTGILSNLFVYVAPNGFAADRRNACRRGDRLHIQDLDMSPDPVVDGQRVREWKVRVRFDGRRECETDIVCARAKTTSAGCTITISVPVSMKSSFPLSPVFACAGVNIVLMCSSTSTAHGNELTRTGDFVQPRDPCGRCASPKTGAAPTIKRAVGSIRGAGCWKPNDRAGKNRSLSVLFRPHFSCRRSAAEPYSRRQGVTNESVI